MKADRLKGLTDAIIAITATIAVLDLKAPENVTWHGLFEQWPNFSAHFISFFIIYLFWFNHNLELSKVNTISTKVFLVNGVWLSFISILPFATKWVGENSVSTLPELVYTAVLFICMLLDQLMFCILSHENSQLRRSELSNLRWRIPIYIGFSLAIIFSFFRPAISLLIDALVVIVNIVEVLMLKEINK